MGFGKQFMKAIFTILSSHFPINPAILQIKRLKTSTDSLEQDTLLGMYNNGPSLKASSNLGSMITALCCSSSATSSYNRRAPHSW